MVVKTQSDYFPINIGVPQDSTLAATLCILHVNDLSVITENASANNVSQARVLTTSFQPHPHCALYQINTQL